MHQITKFSHPLVFSALAGLAFALSGCATTQPAITVSARIVGPDIAPGDSLIFTKPAAGLGVKITASAGGGRRPFVLSGTEVARLVDRMELELARWPASRRSAPFDRTVMIGVSGTFGPEPFSVSLVKRPNMSDPVFLVTVAYSESTASAVLDRANAQKWVRQLRTAARY